MAKAGINQKETLNFVARVSSGCMQQGVHHLETHAIFPWQVVSIAGRKCRFKFGKRSELKHESG